MSRSAVVVAALAAATIMATTSCGGDDDALVTADGLAVLDAWARPTPPTVDEAAFYVTVENRGAPDDRLIGAESDRCVVVTPHATEIGDDEIARMGEADDDRLGLAAGEQVTMEPTGLHLMCLGLSAPLAAGDEVDVVLRFSTHEPITVPVSVEQR